MKDLLFVKALHLSVFATQKPDSKSDEELEFEHQQVCGFIQKFVEENVYNHIDQETHAHTLWEKLESLYASKSSNNKLLLLKKMMTLKYKKGTSTTDHVSEFQSVMNQLLGMGVKFDDEILGLWLLATLPDSWETFWVSLINSAPQGIITLDLANSGVLNEEVRTRYQGSTSQSEVLVTENRGRNRERDGKGRDKSRSKSRSRYKNLECHHCGKKGHIKKYCFKLKRENKGGGDKHDQNDEEKSERAAITREDLMVICDENLVNLACDETSWVIDTGASTHVTSRRDFFTSYTPCDFGVVKMGNDGLVPVTAWEMLACDGQWKLNKASLVVARGKKSSSFYLMQASTSRDSVNVTVNDRSTELWHKRLSHMSEKGLNCVAKKNQLSGLKNATLKNFPHCLVGKQRRVSFSSRPPHRKSELLELVHSDVCGPLKDIGGFDALVDDVVTGQQQAPIAPLAVPLRRSSRDRRSSVRYSSDDYVLLTDEGEPECYEEAMESECKDQWVEAMKDEL
ncbi:hypothetical protein V6N11_070805 [Hibiscus sabdariffa]|uniref:CCHC-type domain-containing protein n=1 Tax=Hibiscus sabdariffa TaxID=183260 RepID=A0ABR2QGN9_9ROSI